MLSGDDFGETYLVTPRNPDKPQYFKIKIDKRLSWDAQYMVIIHEYAHALQWRGQHQESTRLADHDAEWGIAEARCWAELGE